MTSDPVRLLEDPSAAPALRSDLVHATEAQLQGLDLATGLAALQKATAAVTSSTTVVASTSLLAKLGIGAGVAAGVVALWLGLGGGDAPNTDEDERVVGPSVTAGSEPAAAPRAGVGHTAGMKSSAPSERLPQVKVEPIAPPLPAEPAVAEPAVAEPAVAEPKPASRRKADRSPGVSKAGRVAPPAIDEVLREAKLVAKARGNLVREPAQALALAEEAERDFPRGQLVEERRALAIRALVALGRLDEANARAEAFLAEYGRGAHAAAVRRALAGPAEPPGQ
jgi:hypothetical protein